MPSGMGISARDLRDLLPHFDPEWDNSLEAKQWIDTVNKVCTKYQVPDEVKLLQATLKLKGPARTWYQSAQNDINNWEEFVSCLEETFPTVIDKTEFLDKLSKRRQGAKETATAYYFDQLSMAKRIKLDDTTTMNYIIKGVKNNHQRSVLSATTHASPSALLEMMKKMEKAEVKEENTQSTSRSGYKWANKKDNRGRYSPYQRHENSQKSHNQSHNDKGNRLQFQGKSRYHDSGNRRSDRAEPSSNQNTDDKKKDVTQGTSGKIVRLCFLCKSPDHLIRQCPKQKDFPVRVASATTTRSNKDELLKEVTVLGKVFHSFIDLGSNCTLMRQKVADELGIAALDPKSTIHAYGGGKYRTFGCSTQTLTIDGISRRINVHIVPDEVQEEPLLVGKDYFDQNNLTAIIFKEGLTVMDSEKAEKFKMDKENRIMAISVPAPFKEGDIVVGELATQENKKELMNLLNKYRSGFAMNTKELGFTGVEEMKIELLNDTPVKYAAYRVPYEYRKALSDKIKELLAADIIEPSTSNYASPVVVHVKKSSNDIRMCVDYRKLNECIKKEYYPMPHIEEELTRLSGMKVFSCLDLLMGYHQVSVHKDSRKLTAFITTEGLFEFKRVPFGLSNSPAIFMRIMAHVLRPIGNENIICFMDDILVATKDVQEHFQVLEKIFQQLVLHNLTLNPNKCKFLSTNVTFLGHEVSPSGISPGNLKTKAVEEFKQPTTLKGVRRFLGLVGFFRRFIPNFAIISAPLTQMLRKDGNPNWAEEQDKAFTNLKTALVHHPVLALFSRDAEHEVHCDGSKVGIAGVLLQLDKDGNPLPVSYFSRALTAAERKYTSFEWETMAVVETLKRFKYYLLGRHFTIYTDCNALRLTHRARRVDDRIARWWLTIMEYDFEIKYRPGERMAHVDALSRHPPDREDEIEEDDEEDQLVMNVFTQNDDWVVALQLKDHEISRIKDILEDKLEGEPDEKKIRNDFEIVDGRVFVKTEKGLRFYVPRGVRFNVMHAVHNEMGHRELTSCLNQLRKDYWWPRMRRDIKKYIDGCLSCDLSKPGEDENRHQIFVMEKKPIPFYVIHVDFCGAFDEGKRQGHIFGLVDAFTRFCILRAVPSPTSKAAIRVIKEVAQYFGMPAVLVCDQGAAFESKEFKDFCKEYDIKRSPVAVATPRANGQIERMFRTVKDSLRSLSSEQTGKNWAQSLPAIQWALNSFENRVTGESPQMLLMGYRPRNVLKNKLMNAISNTVDDREFQEPLPDIREAALMKMTNHQEQQAQRFNESHKAPHEYKAGDLVLCRWNAPATGTSRKLVPRYRGPYIVEEVMGRDRYLVKDTPVTQVSQIPYENVCSADRLKPWGNSGELSALEKAYVDDNED